MRRLVAGMILRAVHEFVKWSKSVVALGGLDVYHINRATLMKTSFWIPPVVALLVAGAWTGSKYQSLATVEAGNARTRDQIALAQTSRTSTLVKKPNDDTPINWQRLATEEENGSEMQRLRLRLKSMTREEMIDALDRIAMLECSKGRRIKLESAVVLQLGQLDPEWVLTRFQDRLCDNELPLDYAFGNWAGMDLAEATAWLDAQIAAGNLNSKRLDENIGRQPRQNFDAALINVMWDTDPSSAALRLGELPVNQRESVISSLATGMYNRWINKPLTEGNHLAFANLVRSQLPEDLHLRIIADGVPSFFRIEEFPKFNAYMDVIEATPAERIYCAENTSGEYIRMLSHERKVTVADLEILRGHFAGISLENIDVMTARSLVEAASGSNFMRFAQASGLAMELLEASGSDAVLATFLEIAPFDVADKDLGRKLAGEIADESRRTEILKRFK